MLLLFDDTNYRGSDADSTDGSLTSSAFTSTADVEARETDDELFSPEQQTAFAGSNYKAEEKDNDKDSRQEKRQSLIEKAKQSIGDKKSKQKGPSSQSNGALDPEGNPVNSRSNNNVNWDAHDKAKNQNRPNNPSKNSPQTPGMPGSTAANAKTPGAGKGLGKGMKGGKGGGIDPDAIKNITDKATHGDKKGAFLDSAKLLGKVGLEKAMTYCIDSLLPTFGLTLILMNIIFIIAIFTRIKLPFWQKVATIGLDVALAFIIFLIFVFCFGMLYGVCEYGGLNKGGVVAAIASPGAAVVDWWTGNEYGSTFVGICKSMGSVSK